MKKIMQTITGLVGNCQTAVIASLLERDINDVPYFADGLHPDLIPSETERADIFNKRVDDFFESLGYELNWYLPSDEIDRYIREDCKDIPYQVQGKSPRGYQHVVIYMNGEMVHDPHPEGGGVIPQYFGFINKLSN